jgi:hypothetical protein
VAKSDPEEGIIVAYLQRKAVERQRSYLARGRRYRALAIAALDTAWATAFTALCLHGDPSRLQDIDDLSAELSVRGRPTPSHLVEHIMPEVRARLERTMTDGIAALSAAREPGSPGS